MAYGECGLIQYVLMHMYNALHIDLKYCSYYIFSHNTNTLLWLSVCAYIYLHISFTLYSTSQHFLALLVFNLYPLVSVSQLSCLPTYTSPLRQGQSPLSRLSINQRFSTFFATVPPKDESIPWVPLACKLAH